MNERIEMQIGSLMGKKEYEEVQMTFRSEKSCGIRPLARKYWKMAVSAATSEVCILNSEGCWSTIHKICKQDTSELACRSSFPKNERHVSEEEENRSIMSDTEAEQISIMVPNNPFDSTHSLGPLHGEEMQRARILSE
jgi:hypothetical protein